MPPKGDHDSRREDVSQAVWHVLARCGVGGLTIRSVAAELGATTGLIRHYFPTKKALIAHARQVAEDRTKSLKRSAPSASGLVALKAAVIDVLPLDDDTTAMSRAWVSFWDAAIGDPELADSERLRYMSWRARLRIHVCDAQASGELSHSVPADDYVVMCAAFAHGLVVQSLFDPERFTARRQRALVDSYFDQLVL
jgi:AcrR family transcriptional regulator